MVQQNTHQKTAKKDPYDTPEFRAMQAKMRKLVSISMLIMVLGISTVIFVLIYKSMNKKETPLIKRTVAQQTLGEPIRHSLKAGEKVHSMIVENGVVYLLVEGDGMTSVVQIDKKTGNIARRVEFSPQAD